jgi:RES domain-containing protein
VAYHGPVWRLHACRYEATDAGGSLKTSGRYNRGLDLFPEAQCWLALYLGLNPEICLGEIVRHLWQGGLEMLKDRCLSELVVEASALLDCRRVDRLGLAYADLCEDLDYRIPQSVAAAAIHRGAEGLLVPSATALGDNLVLFPTHSRPSSKLAVVGVREPRLYITGAPQQPV